MLRKLWHRRALCSVRCFKNGFHQTEQNLGHFNIEWEQKLSIGQFYGFELNWWPAKIAETAMFLVDHQANKELANAVGRPPERLPIKITAHIHHGNALQLEWEDILPASATKTFIFGNPPFIGQYTKTTEQTADMKKVWGKDYDGYLDYVTGWHAQAMRLLAERRGEFAYVTTNSITQGQPVPALFGPLFREGWRIKFAHRTFAWDSEAPGKAAVHCVIVGFDREDNPRPRLWDYPDVKGEAVEQPVDQGINAYLIDGPNVLVVKRTKRLSPVLTDVKSGRKPAENGNLIIEIDDYEEITQDIHAAKYLRPFRGAKELLRGIKRWCLKLDDMDPKDFKASPILQQRVSDTYKWRSSQRETGDAYKLKDTPAIFRPGSEPNNNFLAMPSVVSETRRYYTVQWLSPDYVLSNLAFWANDPDGLQFSLASSSMFITWQKTIGGRLESRIRFANTLTWNTFPVPELDEKTRQRIINAGKKVLDARALHPERSLAEHYNPLAMDPVLVKAHDALDREVDKAFGAPRKLTTVRQRQELLFANYEKLSTNEK